MKFLGRFLLFFLPLILFPVQGKTSGLIIENLAGVDIKDLALEARFAKAHKLFTEEIAEVNEPVTLSITQENCFRTGYNRATKKVTFCSTQKVLNFGLHSLDVFNHELFHAFLCQVRPELCEEDLREDLHEGLADYFAYRLNPDACFGEDFYADTSCIRKYKTSWHLGLVDKPHERGNVFVSEFIEYEASFKDALKLFSGPQILPEYYTVINGVEASDLNRYRLSPNDVMEIQFLFNASSEVKKIQWRVPKGLIIERVAKNIFRIQLPDEIFATKGTASFLSDSGEELGRRTYYFGKKVTPSSFDF